MPRAAVQGIELEYECFGDQGASPIVLIMGFAAQMIFWDEGFCRALAQRGFRVIRFDNRDVGRSTKVDHLGTVNLATALFAQQMGRSITPPYTLDDMADDVVGLLDALGLDSAHVCGASMGGMIAQVVAYRHPQRARSLISMMSTTGDPSLPQAEPSVTAILLEPAPLDREGYARHSVEVWRALSGPGFPYDEEAVRERARRAFDRGIYPRGIVRQLTAILAHGSRRERLRGVRAPSLVIHGEDDRLVPVAGGHDTARAIAGSRLVLIPGMGHDLPRPAWPRLVEEIAGHARRAEAS
ncbi:MAG TPA: alpha/beta hydrolase [Thermoanaerobaculia bacterium]|nr:alpha/beta hydrolase [Thermoanaerobaculia bacterium]